MSGKKTSLNEIEFYDAPIETLDEDITLLLENLSLKKNEDLLNDIYDLTLPLKFRIKILEKYCSENGEESLGVINKLNSMYIYSFSKMIENYLFHIIIYSNIDIYLKLECAKVLTYNSQKGYEALDWLCSKFGEFPDLATPCKVDSICILMDKDEFKNNCLLYFCDVINDNNIEALYRYKCILSIKIKVQDEDRAKFFTEKSCISFLSNFKNPTTYRILACQYTLIYCEPSDELKDWIEEKLLTFASDNDLDINIRADAADVLLQLGNEENRRRAGEIIIFLGTNGARGRTVFDNAQNVHHKSIEESAIKILEFLNTVPIKPRDGIDVDFDFVRRQILEYLEELEEEVQKEEDNEGKKKNLKGYREKVESALTRILIDRAVYSQYNMSLMNILVKIWNYISNHQYFQEMKKRLVDELFESSDVCSTGYAFRIVNVVSGYGDLSITISFQDQIIGNLAGRLNSKIRELEDEEYQDRILSEMMIDPSKFESRGAFLKFFREHISSIREEMYQEFREYMEDTEYDLLFRRAIFHYEGIKEN